MENHLPIRKRLFPILIALFVVLPGLCGCGIKIKEDSRERSLSKKERENLASKLHTKGLTLDAEGRLEEAIAIWQREIELSPKRVRAYNNIGIAYRRLGKIDVAKEFHQKAIAVDPEFGLQTIAIFSRNRHFR